MAMALDFNFNTQHVLLVAQGPCQGLRLRAQSAEREK